MDVVDAVRAADAVVRMGSKGQKEAWAQAGSLRAWVARQPKEHPPGRFGGDVRAVGWDDPDYPEGLKRCDVPPAALFVRGLPDPLPDPRHCVAIVGARQASDEGLWLTNDLATAAANAGAIVVSGLALGTDAAAHRAALVAGGRTIAVVASAVDQPTPLRNGWLADRIVRGGGWLLSERLPGARVHPRDFPIRNRLVAGLASLVVVVEAALPSGTLSTVAWALQMGMDVAAVPGPPSSRSSEGANALLRAGAHVVTSGDDLRLLLHCPWGRAEEAPDLDEDERRVLRRMRAASAHREAWVRAAGLSPERAHAAVARLLVRGVLRTLGGGRVARVL